MIFYKSRRDAAATSTSTMSLYSMKLANEERCAHCFVFLAIVCLVVAGVMLYYAIATQYSEQKTIYYIVFVVCVLGIGFFGILAWFILGRVSEKRECFWRVQMNTQAVRRDFRIKQEELNEMRSRTPQSQLSRPTTPRMGPLYYVNTNYQPETTMATSTATTTVQEPPRPRPKLQPRL